MKSSKLYVLSIASVVALVSMLLVGVPAAQSLDSAQDISKPNNITPQGEHRHVLEAGQVLIIQTKGGKIELIPGAKVVILQGLGVSAIEGENGEVIRTFENVGSPSDVIALAALLEDEARQFLAAGEVLIPLDSK